jgi:cell division septal protein FtsQ
MSRVMPLRRPPRRHPLKRRPSTAPSLPAPRERVPSRPGLVSRARQRILSGWFVGKLLALLLLGLGAAALVELTNTEEFVVSRVDVAGNLLVPTDEVLMTVELEGTHVLAVRSARAARLLEANPAIARAYVQPRFWGVVRIQLTEREPAVVWESGDLSVLTDADGLALREGRLPLPTVLAPEGPSVEPGGRVDPDAVRIARDVGMRLSALGLPGGQVEYRPSGGVALVAPGAPRVQLGFGDNLDAKLSAYQTIRRHLEQSRTSAQLIDVRFLERPYYR